MASETFIIQKETDLETKKTVNRRTVFDAHARLWMAGVLALSDLFGLFAAIFIAMQIRRLPWLIVDPDYIEVFMLLAATLFISFSRKGLYPAVGLNYVDELQNIVTSTNFSFFILIGVTFLLKNTAVYSRLILLFTWALSLVFIPTIRFVVRRLLIRHRLWGEPVIVIGDPDKAVPLSDYFKINRQFGVRPVAVLHNGSSEKDHARAHTLSSLKEYARASSINTVLIAINDLNSFDRLVDRYRFVFGRVILIKYKNGKFALNHLNSLDFSDVLGLQVKNNLLSFPSQVFKRVIDLLLSILGLVLLAPFLGFIALAIKIDAPGRVFYRQKRLGRHGKEFTLLKFRTMHLNADRLLKAEFERDPELKQEWDRYQKLKNDPRITRVGRWLRKFSLDELPQLWNVVLGEMSLVGPRPIMVHQREMYGGTFKEYIQVSPGITGLWQVSGRNQTTFARRAELDDEYIQRWSQWLDIYILLKTVTIVLGKNGAF